MLVFWSLLYCGKRTSWLGTHRVRVRYTITYTQKQPNRRRNRIKEWRREKKSNMLQTSLGAFSLLLSKQIDINITSAAAACYPDPTAGYVYIQHTIVDLDGVLNNTWRMEGTRGARYSLLLAFLPPSCPHAAFPNYTIRLATGYDAVVHPVSWNNTRLHYSSCFSCWVPPLFFFALRGNDAMGGSRVDCRRVGAGKIQIRKRKGKKNITERWNEVWWSKWRVPLHKRLLPPRWRWKMCYMYIKQWRHLSEPVCVAALLITICSVCDEWKYRLKGRSGVGLLIVTFLGRPGEFIFITRCNYCWRDEKKKKREKKTEPQQDILRAKQAQQQSAAAAAQGISW